MSTHPHRLLGALVAGLLVLAACGTADESSTTTAPSPDTTHTHAPTTTAQPAQSADVGAQIALHSAMRKLWGDHMFWTYATVDAFFNNQDELPANLDRILANQVDIGNAIKPYFGDAAGDQLTELLTTHIQLAVPVLTAAQEGDTEALDAALVDWYANAEDVAEFVSAAGSETWPLSVTGPMLKGHIDTTVVYSTALLTGDYAGAVAEFDAAYEHMLMLADALADGIVTQFPDRFEN